MPEKKLSYKVFLQFVGTNGEADALLEKACFEEWVATRKTPPQHPAESFRRVLTAHVCGLDGRKPFPKPVEDSLLPLLRKKETWPCFHDTEITIGVRGFRKQGFHEKQQKENLIAASSNETKSTKSKSSRKRKVSEICLSDDSLFSGLSSNASPIDSEKKAKIPEAFLTSPGMLGLRSLGLNLNLVDQYNLNQLQLQILFIEQMKLINTLNMPGAMAFPPTMQMPMADIDVRPLIPVSDKPLS